MAERMVRDCGWKTAAAGNFNPAFEGDFRCCLLGFLRLFTETQPQRVELDEALGVALVVDLIGLEGDMREAVERFRRFAPDDARLPL